MSNKSIAPLLLAGWGALWALVPVTAHAQNVTIFGCVNAGWNAPLQSLICVGGCPNAVWDVPTATLTCGGSAGGPPVCSFNPAAPPTYSVGSQLSLNVSCTNSPTYAWSATVGTLGTGGCTTAATCTDTQASATNVTYHLVATNAQGSATLDAPVAWVVGATPPVLQSAASRRVHGASGAFDLALSLADIHNPTTESRQGPAQTLVFTFDKPISAASVSVTEGAATAGAPTFSGSSVIVDLTGVTNQQYVTVSLTGVVASDGGTGGSGLARVGFLAGDVNRSRVVTVADFGLVNAELAHAVTASNFLEDVNASGSITVADKGVVSGHLTTSLPTP